MDGLFALIIFIIVIIGNILKNKKSGSPASPPSRPESGPDRQPSSIEEFFEELAEKFGPQPRKLPDWPENIERPDYAQEMREYATPKPPPSPPPAVKPARKVAVPAPVEPAVPATVTIQKAATFKLPSQASVFAGMSGMRISMPPLLRSATGQTRFDLETREQLRQAMIANMVFGTPRAYDTSFDNTMAK